MCEGSDAKPKTPADSLSFAKLNTLKIRVEVCSPKTGLNRPEREGAQCTLAPLDVCGKAQTPYMAFRRFVKQEKESAVFL